MAALTLSLISAALSLVYADDMASQINRSVVLPNLLPVDDDRNSSCTWRVKVTGRNTAAAKAEGHDVSDGDFSTDTRLQANLTWAEYFSYIKVSGLAQSVAAAERGTPNPASPGGDLMADEVNDAIDELAVLLSDDTYGGSVAASPVEIEGLARAVTSSGSYAGIAQSSYPEWAAAVDTLAAGSLSIANLREKLHRPFWTACGLWPEFVLCDGATFDKVCALFGDQVRQMVDVVTTQARGEVKLKAQGGFRAVSVDGIPYIQDRHCTASTLYAMHSSAASYRQVPPTASRYTPDQLQAAIKQLTGVTLDYDQVFQAMQAGSKRLQPYIELLAKTGDSNKAMVKWYGQLRIKHRNRTAKLTLT